MESAARKDRKRGNYLCGEKALYTALWIHGVECTVSSISRRVRSVDANGGESLEDLAKAAKSYGFTPVVVHLSASEIDGLPPGSIIHLRHGSGHFSTLIGVTEKYVTIADAPMPPHDISRRAFVDLWSGYALVLFRTPSEAEAFTAESVVVKAWQYSSIGVLVMTCLLMWPSVIRRFRAIVSLSVVISFACIGCSDSARNAPGTGLRLPQLPIDAGYVPVSGKTFPITLLNASNQTVTIRNVETSCGCTHVSHPDTVQAGQDFVITVAIAGSPSPLNRQVVVTAQTEPFGKVRLPIIFGTGDVPVLKPEPIQFQRAEQGGYTSHETLWLKAFKGDEFVLEESSHGVSILPAPRYKVLSDRKAVIVKANGLVAIQLNISRTGKCKVSGIGTIVYRCGNRRHSMDYDYTTSSKDAVDFFPSRVAVHLDGGEVLERVFLATAPFEFTPRVDTFSNGCKAKFQKITPSCWKLIVRIDPSDVDNEAKALRVNVIAVADRFSDTFAETFTIDITR